MTGRRQERHYRPSRSECQQRRVSTQLNLLANHLPEVNQDFLNLARTQLDAFNELQRGRQPAHFPTRSRSRSPETTRHQSRSSPPYTSYRQPPRQPSPTARPWTPPTPYSPISPQEPLESDTLPDAPNRSPTPVGTRLGHLHRQPSASPRCQSVGPVGQSVPYPLPLTPPRSHPLAHIPSRSQPLAHIIPRSHPLALVPPPMREPSEPW